MTAGLVDTGDGFATLVDVLDHRGEHTPEAPAFVMGGDVLSFGALRERCWGTAAALARAGVRKGDVCALMLPTGLDVVRLLFAAQAIGAVPVLLDSMLAPEQAAARFRLVRARLAVVGRDALAGVRAAMTTGAGGRVESVDALDGRASGQRPVPGPTPDDPALLLLTSGTSGEPRAAVILHRNVMASVRSSHVRFEIRPTDVFVNWVPLHHALGMMRFILGPVYFGCPVHLVTPSVSNLRVWLETITRVRATVTGGPDFGYRVAARMADVGTVDLRSLRFAMSSGEPVRRSTIGQFERTFGIAGVVRPGYGLAEGNGVCNVAPGEPLRVDATGNLSCGRPLDGLELEAVDEAGRVLPPGTVGEIRVRGPHVFAGYLDNPAATARKLRDGWLYTGDAGALDADGHLYVVGRLGVLIKRGGVAIAPRELEEAAERVGRVLLAGAVSAPRPSGLGEHVVVVAETQPETVPSEEDGVVVVREICNEIAAASGFVPNRVLLVRPETLPRTPSGKIRHVELRRLCTGAGTIEPDRVLFGSLD